MSSRRPTVLHALSHHAEDKAPIANAIALVFATMLRPAGWDIVSVLGGPESYKIYNTTTGKEFHFRNGGHKCIHVYTNYYWKALKLKPIKLQSRVDVIHWAESVLV